ncbi:hypothetical protein [Parvibaculum sp.]|jgi:aspartyl/asparaginyl beta-hydroxylase (cupin superfamily)|uniref:hypothetical protein n=1 Tax=Parvibaculum sp. TaxID=2024848 RepID=UPI000C93981F|nr:hypothetical protein [Parvibaculum sp.]MAB13688.1 hypothetical protein [Parvibaculum sp.]
MNAAENWMALCDNLDQTTDQFMTALERVNRRLIAFGRRPLTEEDVLAVEDRAPDANILPFRSPD